MWTHDVFDQAGRLQYFEITSLVTRYFAYRIAASIPDARIVKKPRLWRFGDDDVFCVFEVGGMFFEIWEPYGDNSRFHIGANPLGWSPQLEAVRDAFARRGIVRVRRLHAR